MRAFKNEKGFKIIEASAQEIVSIGGWGICDCCNIQPSNGYLIPVLSASWYCEKCYTRWTEEAEGVYHENDKAYEDRTYDYYLALLKERNG
ncbi:hypothetical protein ACHJH3_06655 [Campylobacter sp. MOP7]